jgi:hypothetical protein
VVSAEVLTNEQRTVEFERTALPKGSRLKLTVAPEPGSMTLLKRFLEVPRLNTGIRPNHLQQGAF